MLHIIFGLCMLCFGIIVILSNWWAVIDFVKVIIPLVVLVFGVLSILTGISSMKKSSK